jgi:hypothetical protein
MPEIYGVQLYGYLDGSIEVPEKEMTVKDKDGVESTIPNPDYGRCCARSVCSRVSGSEYEQGGSHTDGGTPHFCSRMEGCDRDVCFTISGTSGAASHQAQPMSKGK